MNAQTIAILAGGLRALLAATVGVVAAKYIPDPVLSPTLALIGVAAICVWSVIQKLDTEQDAFPIVMGALRNFGAAVTTYAISRGWLTGDQAKEISGAAAVAFVMLTSAEQKKLTVNK
jgi:hypothetical protein